MAQAVTEGRFRKSYDRQATATSNLFEGIKGAKNREAARLYQSRILKSKRLSADKILARFLSRCPHQKLPRRFTP